MIINSSDNYGHYSFLALVGEGDEGRDGRRKNAILLLLLLLFWLGLGFELRVSHLQSRHCIA
jgi:hypothetical protein